MQRWGAYRKKRGTLNWGMRIERGAALLAVMYANAHRPKGVPPLTVHDFMPNAHANEIELTLEEAQRTWR